MKKLFLKLVLIGLLSNCLFAETNSKKANFLFGIGFGYESNQENIKNSILPVKESGVYYKGYSEESSKYSNNYPIFIYTAYRFYIKDKLALEPRLYSRYSQGKSYSKKTIFDSRFWNLDADSYTIIGRDDDGNILIDIKKQEESSNGKYSKIDLGLMLAIQYDFYRYSPKAIFGIELGLGYEYSIINNKFDNKDFEKNFKVENTRSMSFDYGLYFIYDNTHRISINSQIKNYSKKSSKVDYNEYNTDGTIRKLGEFEYSLTPGNYTTTISYSYLF